MKRNNIVEISAIALLLIMAVSSCLMIKSQTDKYEISKANEKALLETRDSLSTQCRELTLTVEQYRYLNDSITQKYKEVQKAYDIKDKDLRSAQYILSKSNKVDTVVVNDTIFKDIEFSFDTVLQDKWSKTDLSLKYPNKITVSSQMNSELIVLLSTVKETVEPPKKFFLCRWLQKKQKVVKATVQETNPYVTITQKEFIKILN